MRGVGRRKELRAGNSVKEQEGGMREVGRRREEQVGAGMRRKENQVGRSRREGMGKE